MSHFKSHEISQSIMASGLIDQTQRTIPPIPTAMVTADSSVFFAMQTMISQKSSKAMVIDGPNIIGTITMADLLPVVANLASKMETEFARLQEAASRTQALISAASDELSEHMESALKLTDTSSQSLSRHLTEAKGVLSTFQGVIEQQSDAFASLEKIELTSFLSQLIATLQTSARLRGINLALSPAATVHILANPRNLGQALRHLLDEAIRKTAKGAIITITTNIEIRPALVRPDRIVTLRANVTPADGYNPKIGEPDLEPSFAGKVINSLVAELEKTHRGLRYKNNAKSGNIFEVSAPAINSLNESPTMFEAIKILVVEDDEDILEMLENIVTNRGFQVITANNGEDALEKFKSDKPKLVLADIRMPRLDGIELTNAIKSLDENMPIILFSGQYPNLMEDKMENRIKCDHVLYKPFAQSDIIESLSLFLPMPIAK